MNAFAIVAEPDAVGAALIERYGKPTDRLQFYAPYKHDAQMWSPIIADIKALAPAT
ncbi:hypothetical protein ACHMWU_11020 [Aeromicrobium sp. UC242_57]